jgi:hypothetical protein
MLAALLLLIANSAYADIYKCQSEERVVLRDRPCLPGEREIEVTHFRAVRPTPAAPAAQESSDLVQRISDRLRQLAAYCQNCAMGKVNAPACRAFWTWSGLGVVAIITLILSLFARRLIKEQKAINEHKRWLAAQGAVADAVTVKQHTWEGDAAADVDMTQEELAAAIRNATKQNPQI